MDAVADCSFLEVFAKQVCRRLPDYRDGKIQHPCGFLTFCVLLCECAGKTSQRSKVIWISANFRLICSLWKKATRSSVSKSPASQSTISRHGQNIDNSLFSNLLAGVESNFFKQHWKLYKKKCREKNKIKLAKSKEKKNLKRKRNRSLKRNFELEPDWYELQKPLPQYCFDGKSRSGCISSETGRTIIDVTMFCPETNQVLASRTLPDKKGESSAVIDILQNEGKRLPKGVVTGDAGILSPEVVREILAAGHQYLLQIKGNAGHAFEEVLELPWENVKVVTKAFKEGHGRQEIRFLKRIEEGFVDIVELAKYEDFSAGWERDLWTHLVKEDTYTSAKKYLIGSSEILHLKDELILLYITDHWKQESYHWIKDVVLKEDASFQRAQNGSQFLGIIRSIVARIGLKLFNSVTRFVDHFSSSPKEISKKL